MISLPSLSSTNLPFFLPLPPSSSITFVLSWIISEVSTPAGMDVRPLGVTRLEGGGESRRRGEDEGKGKRRT